MRIKYYIKFLPVIIFLCLFKLTIGQTTSISGIINSYAVVTSVGSATCSDSITVNSVSGFATGDSVMLIQIQGADIDSTNTSSFGTILNYANCGNYEFLKIASINGLVIHFTTSLKKNYDVNGTVQLVSIPHYSNALVTGVLTAQAWNGTTGGILAFTVSGTLTFNNNIDLNGLGFRGGSASPNYYSSWHYGYCFGASPGRGGKKGEGIAPYFINKEYGRGAQANGGGAGNDINTGAAGGGNYGEGGHGGNNHFAPDTLWGLRGKSLTGGISQDKIFFGGGGGGGHQNNSAGTAGSKGGGIIFIRSGNIVGNNHIIKSNGMDVTGVAGIDGAGGGGAGGSILLDVVNFTANLSIEVKGGKGGDQNYPPQCHGNGGGGGGGVIFYSGSVFPGNVTTSVIGGAKGIGQCNNTPDDAAIGQDGAVMLNWTIPVTIIIADAGPDKTICQGDSVQIGTPPSGGLTYNWTNGAGNISNPFVSPNTSTTFILTVSDGGCNFAYDTVIVNVSPKPSATFTYVAGCGLTVNFTNTSTGIQSSLWYFGDGDSSVQTSPVHTYSTIGNYTVTLIVVNSFGCKDTIIQQINIVSTGLAGSQFTFQIQNCTGTVVFTNQSVNATGYIWNFGDGSPNSNAANPTHTYLTSGTFTATLIATNSCSSDTMQQQITINIIPTVVAAFAINTQQCSLSVNLTNQSQNGITYQWNFGDGSPVSTVTNPTHIYLTAGTYTITLIATNSCGSDTLQQQIILNVPQPVAAAFTINIQPCSYTINIINQTQNGASYQWTFGDGSQISTIANPTHIYASNGTFTVTLIAANSCGSDTLQQQVTINVPQTAVASFTVNTQPCDLTVSFINQSQNATTWQWNFGDGTTSALQNPSHTFTATGIYNVTLIAGNGCSSDTMQQQVDLSDAALPQSDFEFSTQPCDLTLSLTNQSQYADSLLWDFGDGTTDTAFAPVHFYQNNGIYFISLVTYNQCGTDTLIKTVIDTFSQGIALFELEQQPCNSEVKFINQSQHASGYSWNFGDGNSDTTKNPVHKYLFSGNYTITLIINQGTLCADTMIKTETINNSDTSNLFVPNCFTPNGDSKNEVLRITGFNECEVYHLRIYNRWGQSVYETDDINKFWDGKFKNKDVPEGVYYFIVTGKLFSKNGAITVIR